MKINQNKLDKITMIVSIVGMDAMAIYCATEIFTFNSDARSWHHLIFMILALIGYTPLLISLHIKDVPKHIQAKLSYFLVFCCSTAVVILFGYDALNMRLGKDLIFNLVACIWFTFYIVVSLIKLFSKQVPEILTKE